MNTVYLKLQMGRDFALKGKAYFIFIYAEGIFMNQSAFLDNLSDGVLIG